MNQTIFIAGTDTNVGKTYVTVKLLNTFQQLGFTTVALKPVASGAAFIKNQLYNDDALQLREAASIKLPYDHINPILFEPPIAPNIAANLSKQSLSVEKLIAQCQPGLSSVAEICLVEGAGGWHTPLNEQETLADFVKTLEIPVILVIGLRLGCLNHAILTANAIRQQGIALLGWIANMPEPSIPYAYDMITTLKQHISAPCLEVVEHGKRLSS